MYLGLWSGGRQLLYTCLAISLLEKNKPPTVYWFLAARISQVSDTWKHHKPISHGDAIYTGSLQHKATARWGSWEVFHVQLRGVWLSKQRDRGVLAALEAFVFHMKVTSDEVHHASHLWHIVTLHSFICTYYDLSTLGFNVILVILKKKHPFDKFYSFLWFCWRKIDYIYLSFSWQKLITMQYCRSLWFLVCFS